MSSRSRRRAKRRKRQEERRELRVEACMEHLEAVSGRERDEVYGRWCRMGYGAAAAEAERRLRGRPGEAA